MGQYCWSSPSSSSCTTWSARGGGGGQGCPCHAHVRLRRSGRPFRLLRASRRTAADRPDCTDPELTPPQKFRTFLVRTARNRVVRSIRLRQFTVESCAAPVSVGFPSVCASGAPSGTRPACVTVCRFTIHCHKKFIHICTRTTFKTRDTSAVVRASGPSRYGAHAMAARRSVCQGILA